MMDTAMDGLRTKHPNERILNTSCCQEIQQQFRLEREKEDQIKIMHGLDPIIWEIPLCMGYNSSCFGDPFGVYKSKLKT